MRLLCASVCVCTCVCGETANTRGELDKFYFVSLSFYVRFTPAAWKQLALLLVQRATFARNDLNLPWAGVVCEGFVFSSAASRFVPLSPLRLPFPSAPSSALPLNEIINWLSFGHPARWYLWKLSGAEDRRQRDGGHLNESKRGWTVTFVRFLISRSRGRPTSRHFVSVVKIAFISTCCVNKFLFYYSVKE